MHCAAVLFDMDGTLVDTVDLWVDAYTETLAEFGAAMDRAEFVAGVYHANRALPEVLADHGIDDREGFRTRRDARYIALLEARTLWLPGAQEALERLRSRRLGIVTTAWSGYFDAIDRNHGLRDRIEALVTVDDTRGRAKPDPYPLLLGAERLGVAPGDCMYVGDQAYDAVAARAAGMASCIVRTPHTAADATADLLLDSLDELF